MDIAEKRLPQDGRIGAVVQARRFDLRVSSLPTLHGEKIVLRILDVQSQPLSFDALGMPNKELAQLKHAIHRPNGMVLITGPTGSGKTVTLYTCLNHLNSPFLHFFFPWPWPGTATICPISISSFLTGPLSFCSVLRLFI
jgi:type IV pilus assembly protein PilB